jgi:hypothetical protein
MKESSAETVALVLACLLGCLTVWAAPESVCSTWTIPIRGDANSPLELISQTLETNAAFPGAYTTGNLLIRNRSENAWYRLFVLATYFDDRGHEMFSIPYFAATEGEAKFPGGFFLYMHNRIGNPISPGSTLLMAGTNLFVIRKKPSFVRVAYYSAASKQSSTMSSFADWSLLPVLRKSPERVRFDSIRGPFHGRVVITATVGKDGRITTVEKQSADSSMVVDMNDLSRNLKSLEWIPGSINGATAESRIALRVSFHTNEDSLSIPECSFAGERLPAIFATVDFLSSGSASSPGLWRVFYSGQPAFPELRGGVLSSSEPKR